MTIYYPKLKVTSESSKSDFECNKCKEQAKAKTIH